jgi:lipopolysaccharide transport system ATP-binding protein
MSESVIVGKDLSKLYRIGLRKQAGRTFRETLADGLMSPIRNFKRIRQLTRFEELGNPQDRMPPGGNGVDPRRNGILWALKNVSFEVKKGEVLGIIGRNGSGKSTLLKILSRITEPTRGEAMIYGSTSSILEVGMGFHPELTGRENIFLNGAIMGMKKKQTEAKFDEIVSFAEVDKFIDTPVKRYSSGMYVRLAFSVAAYLESDIMIIDEVLAVGDAAFQDKCLRKMDTVAQKGRTILFVSHNLGVIERLCGRAILLHEGSMIAEGRPSEVIAQYVEHPDYANDASNSLVDHPNRKEGSEIILREARMYRNGQESGTFRSGDSMKIAVSFRREQPIIQMHFGIAIENAAGQRLSAFPSTVQAPRLVPDSVREGKIICEIPCLHLSQGTYYLTFLIRSLYSPSPSDLDRINQAVKFTVVASDYFGPDYGTVMKPGVYFEKAKWAFEKI